jgi:GntR family transcriptional repressor for pyruvate dehydrogenase complex
LSSSLLTAFAEDGRTLPDRIADHFIARIFTGSLAPGERLPPDRELAPLLGVDRTSLRMAMQQLSRMGLIRAVRGSGVSVLDYREHAGLDFLAAVFALRELSLGGSFLLQALDDWIDLMPVLVGRAFARATAEDVRRFDAIVSSQLAALDSGNGLSTVAELEVSLQDQIIRVLGNTALVLLANSSRPFRLRLVCLYFEECDVRAHVEAQRAQLRQIMSSLALNELDIVGSYRAYLRQCTSGLRKRLQALPVGPALVSAQQTERRRPRRGRKAAKRANPVTTGSRQSLSSIRKR